MQNWSKRTLVYVEPKGDAAAVLQNVRRETPGRVEVHTSSETANYVATQVKYTVVDFRAVLAEGPLADLFGQVQVLQMTARRKRSGEAGAVAAGYFNEWDAWMRPGVSVSVAPQSVDTWKAYHDVSVAARDTLLRAADKEHSEMVFEKEWWTWVGLDEGMDMTPLFATLGLVTAEEEDWDAVEIVLDKSRLSVYLYGYHPAADADSVVAVVPDRRVARHEYIVLTEMAPVEDDSPPDRFLQGVRGSADADAGETLTPTMFVHMPSEYVLPHAGFHLRADQTQSASMHPALHFDLDLGYDPWSFLPHDEDVSNRDACQLHAELTLSHEYIVDKYELGRLVAGRYSCLADVAAVSNGGMDLELPAHRVPEWGSVLDLVLDPACVRRHNGSFDVPLHLRYPDPAEPPQTDSDADGGVTDASLLRPPIAALYWTCPLDSVAAAPALAASFHAEPGRFPLADASSTRRYYFPASTRDTAAVAVRAPWGDARHAGAVDAATAFVVAAGSLVLAAVTIFNR